MSRRWQVISTLAAWVVTWLGLVFVQGMPSSTSGRFGYVGGIAFVVPDKVEIAATTAHFVAWLAVGAAVGLRGSHALGLAAAAVLYVARCRTSFLSLEHIQQRDK